MKKPATYYKKFDKEYRSQSENFQKIIDFYLFSCPTPDKSRRGKTFNQYGWNGSPQFAQLKKKMLNTSSLSLKSNYYPCTKDELSEKFETIKNIRPFDEYCVFLKYDENTVMQSLYAAIRNAFAHGSFNVQKIKDTNVYFLANYDKYLKAEIVLLESTMLEWIAIVKKGYTPQ